MKKIILLTIYGLSFFYKSDAAIFTVNSNSDVNSGTGSSGTLRWCITQANLTVAKDTIVFSIASTFTVGSVYPTISNPLYINGFSATGAVQGQLGTGTRQLKIILNGPGNATDNCFNITASNCEISGLVIQNFYNGIKITGASGNFIWGNFIGTAADGLTISATTSCYDDGIRLNNNANSNIIGTNGDGSNDANEGNLISGNGDGGLQYQGEGIAINEGGTITNDCSANRIAGNYIGTNETGTAALFPGATADLQRGSGIQITYSTANIIGTNADGISDALERNIISGNSDCGIVLVGATGNKIKGNYIGTTKTGLVGLPNYGNEGTKINAVQIILKTASNNNFIGTDGDGINDNIEGNVIGSTTIATGSVNVSYSYALWVTGSTGNKIAGNYIGIGADGVTALNIITTGGAYIDKCIYISSTATSTVVGTNGDGISDAFESNYLGNSGAGVTIDNSNNCIVAGNYIGLGSNKITSEALGSAGVYIIQSGSCRVGSSVLNINEMNYICNSTQYGIWIDDLKVKVTDFLNIRYNTIGQRPDNTPAPNAKHGIYLVGESDADTIQYNIITRNGTASSTGVYAGIRIGETYASGESRHNYIYKNTIYKNIGPGIEIVNSISFDNLITQNSIYNNGNGSDATGKLKLGIDLNDDGVTLNDTKDPDSGPNDLSNFPVITSATQSGASCGSVAVAVAGTFNGLANTQYYIEVFSNDVCNGDTAGVDYFTNASYKYGEGRNYEATSTVFTTDGSGNAAWTANLTLSSLAGRYLTAVAIQNTAALKNTSEFSMCYEFQADYGDAPDTYHTLNSNCGPVHTITNTLKIGATVTPDNNGQPSAQANLDSDDGVGTFPTLTHKSTSYTLSNIPVTNTTGSSATLYAWIDFNRNGSFEVSEYASATVANGATTASLSWNLSAFTCEGTLVSGVSYLRMRLTTNVLTDVSGTTAVDERCYGTASNGEVEDYKIYISGYDYGDLPNTYPVAIALCLEDTATAKVWGGVNKPSAECTQKFSVDATGDGVEEDGLTTNVSTYGTTTNWVLKLNANQAAKTVYYGLWIDWDGNANFTSSADAFYSGSATITGATNISIAVYTPFSFSFSTGMRVMISDAAVTSTMYNATIINGEIEDYSLLRILINPANLLSGNKQGNTNILKWVHTTSKQIKTYLIERSNDISNWSTLGMVNIDLTDPASKQMIYTDMHPISDKNSYRLKLVFADGSFQYSNIITLSDNATSGLIIVYPNPAIEVLQIRTTNSSYNKYVITDVTGRIFLSGAIDNIQTSINISSLPVATYIVKAITKEGTEHIQKFVKIK